MAPAASRGGAGSTSDESEEAGPEVPEAVTVVVEETHPLPEVSIHTEVRPVQDSSTLFFLHLLGPSHPSDAGLWWFHLSTV